MSFLVPAFAALAALALVPIAIHLFGRPRAERRVFPALAFLRASDRKTATQRRVRDVLLLLARAAVIALVPLLLAKPFVERPSDALAGLGATESAVIVVDDSRSMGYVLDGKQLVDRAKEEARRIVLGLGRSSEAAVLLTSKGSLAPASDLTSDRDRLTAAVAGIAPTQRTGDTGSALRRAVALLASANHPARRVYLVSDLAAHSVAGDLASVFPAGGPTLTTVDVTHGRALGNRAVTAVRVDAAPELGPHGVRVDAEIVNFDDKPASAVAVTLRLDGKAVAAGLVDVPARGRVVKRFLHTFRAPADSKPSAPGATHDGSVEIAGGDGLADDDRRFFRADEKKSVRVLVVDGDPRTQRRDDEVWYVETALHPGDLDDFQFDVRVLSPDELTRAAVDASDVLLLCNIKAPDAERIAFTRRLLARGGGLFLSLGSNVDPDAWNAAFGDLLPQPLAGLRTVGATRDGRDDGELAQAGVGERVDRIDRRHAILEPFAGRAQGGSADEGLREARVSRYALLKPGAGDRRVLLALEGGAPLLVEGRVGEGRVLLLTTTVDRDWSDLAIQPAFLPLVQQVVRYLASAPRADGEAGALVSGVRSVEVGEGETAIAVTSPSGKQALALDGERVQGRRSVECAATGEPGVYHVSAAREGGSLSPRPARDFAVNVDPAESDLAPIPPAQLAALTRPPASTDTSEPPRRRVELWHALGLALLALLVLEGLLGARRS